MCVVIMLLFLSYFFRFALCLFCFFALVCFSCFVARRIEMESRAESRGRQGGSDRHDKVQKH